MKTSQRDYAAVPCVVHLWKEQSNGRYQCAFCESWLAKASEAETLAVSTREVNGRGRFAYKNIAGQREFLMGLEAWRGSR